MKPRLLFYCQHSLGLGHFVRSLALAEALAANEAKIDAELIAAQGKPVDTGGYYLPDQSKTSTAMRPSATLNAALAAL